MYLAVIVACFVLAIILFRMGQKLGRFLFTAIVVGLISLSFFATLGGSVYRGAMKKYRLIQQVSQSDLDEDKPDSDDPKDYEDESAIYNWTEEQINSLRTKDQDYLGPVTSLSEVIREHPQAKGAWRSIKVHSSGIMHKSVDLEYTDQNSPIKKAQLLRLSFEYNEKKKDYYLSYNSVDRGHW